MANSDKNILITPNKNLGGIPDITLTGAGNSSITLKIPDSATATLNFESSGTNLLSIDSNSSSGGLLSITDENLVSIFNVTANGDINISPQNTTSIGGDGLVLPSYSSTSLPPGEDGLIFYDNSVKCVKLYSNSKWINLTEPDQIRNGLVLELDAGNTKSYPGILDNITGWRRPSVNYIRGTLSDDNRIWSSEPDTGYSSVILNKTFAAGENFEVIAYWAHDYRGIGMVYGPNVSVSDFTGYSVDGTGPYFGALSTSGFPSGYSASFFGQYHSPISGQGAQTTGYWFKWARTGDILSLQYSATSSTGPWTNILGDISISNTDMVIVGAGEASSNEVADLSLISVGPGPYTWTDLSGNRNNGTLTNGPTYSSANGGYLSFDGSNDYINLPYLLLSGSQDFTVNIWVKSNSHSTGTIFCNYPAGNLQLFYGTVNMGMWLNNSSTYLDSPGTEFTTNPVLFTAQRIGGNETRVYLNGILKKTGSSTSTIGSVSNFRIGTNTAGSEVYNGNIAQVSIYNRALSATEIQQNYNAQRGRFGI